MAFPEGRRQRSLGSSRTPLVLTRRSDQQEEHARRLGGATWDRSTRLPAGQIQTVPLTGPRVGSSGPALAPKRRRPLYRRPLLVIPLVLLLLAGSAAGYVAYRVQGSLGQVQSVSVAPPVVETTDEEFGETTFSIDTSPATDVLTERGLAPEGNDTGLLGDFQNGAGGITDLAAGAAALVNDSGASAPITVLLAGVDARPGAAIDVGVRADTIAIARIDPVGGACRVLSVPRDTRVELPGYGQSKVNHALLVGGLPYLQLVLEDTLDITIDHYGLIDFGAFAELVDHFGTITIDVDHALIDNDGRQVFAAGPQEMDGETALRYARFRAYDDGGDTTRVERQWQILRALGSEAERGDVVRDVNALFPALSDHIRTDLGVSELVDLAQAIDGRCTSADVETDQLDGNRVRQLDAILQQSVYFNVVTDAIVQERVRWLIG